MSTPTTAAGEPSREDIGFTEIVHFIDTARQRGVQTVSTVLIDLYWQTGIVVSRKIAAAEWGDGVVDQSAAHITRTHPGLRRFTRRTLLRMRQFHDLYREAADAVVLVRQLPWTQTGSS